jgi:CBS domain-containing protein
VIAGIIRKGRYRRVHPRREFDCIVPPQVKLAFAGRLLQTISRNTAPQIQKRPPEFCGDAGCLIFHCGSSRHPMNTSISVLLERKGSTVFSMPPDVTVVTAVKEMDRHKIGAILVIDNGRIVGIFTERDVLTRVVAAGLDPKKTPIERVMSRDPMTVPSTTTVEEVMTLFTDKRFRHLPVVDGGRLVGMVSIGDILRRMVDTHRQEAEQLKQYITGGYPT